MFERFSDRARAAIALAQEESRLLGHSAIGAEHILLGLLREGHGPAARALESLGVSLAAARDRLASAAEQGSGPAGHVPFTPEAKRCLEVAHREASQLGHDYIGTEHILLGLAADAGGGGARLLASLGADRLAVRQRVLETIPAGLVPADLTELEDQIERVRRDTEAAIDAHDFRTAEALSDTEHELMAERDRRSRQRAAAPLADQVSDLQTEVDRLSDLLRRHGIDPGPATAS